MSRTRKVMAIMFGVVLAVIAVGAFAGIAIASAVQGTAAKIIQGDTVNCPISQVQLVNPGSTNDAADLARFLTGFLNATVSVHNVIPAGDFVIGSIIGLAPPVKVSTAQVLSITRNGITFT